MYLEVFGVSVLNQKSKLSTRRFTAKSVAFPLILSVIAVNLCVKMLVWMSVNLLAFGSSCHRRKTACRVASASFIHVETCFFVLYVLWQMKPLDGRKITASQKNKSQHPLIQVSSTFSLSHEDEISSLQLITMWSSNRLNDIRLRCVFFLVHLTNLD